MQSAPETKPPERKALQEQYCLKAKRHRNKAA
jgi:hypothetical protein